MLLLSLLLLLLLVLLSLLAGSLPPCASGSWTNATSWVATSNASAPWRLVRLVLVPLGASWRYDYNSFCFCFAWHA